MVAPKVDDDTFVDVVEKNGVAGASRIIGMSQRAINRRRRNLEIRLKRPIKVPDARCRNKDLEQHPARVHIAVENGVVLIGSDSHYYPGIISPAHRAFVKFCRELRPVVVIKNGDEIDGSSISRFPPIGWENRPRVVDEIEATSDRLDEIFKASSGAKHLWPLGNHDARYETRLATVAPEYAKIHGMHLKDHFPGWHPCWSVWINDDVVVKHRYKGGVHATRNNTLNAGKTMITGHLHSLKVTPLSDYNGTRWGVDCGTMADPYGPQFRDYCEDNPVDWRQGFVVLTFFKGRLMWPEVVHVIDDEHVEFRGKVYSV